MNGERRSSPTGERRAGGGRRLDAGIATLGLGALAFALAVWSDWDRTMAEPSAPNLLRLLIDSARIFTLDPDTNAASRDFYLVPRLLAAAAVATGVTGVVLRVVPELRQRLLLWWFDVRSGVPDAPGHVVICGLGRIGIQLVKEFGARSAQRLIVAIERDASNPRISEARRHGAVVLLGDAREEALLAEARIARAGHVYLVCGEDSTNLDLVGDIEKALAAHREPAPGKLRCFAHMVDPQLAEACRSQDVFRRRGGVEVKLFNALEISARALLLKQLGPRCAARRDVVPHYLLFGFGRMGAILARESAKLAHFASCARLRMSVIDDFESDAAVAGARDRFVAEHPGFCPAPGFDLDTWGCSGVDGWHWAEARPKLATWHTRRDCPDAVEYAVNAEFLALDHGAVSRGLLDRLERRVAASGVEAALVVCFDDDRRNFKLASQLRERLPGTPLFVYLPDDPGVAELLKPREGASGNALGAAFAFGACEDSVSSERICDDDIRTIARVIHEAYEEESEGASGPAKPWDELDPEWLAANEEAARHLDLKLQAIGCARAFGAQRPGAALRVTSADLADANAPHVQLLMRIEHNRWMAERLVNGWRYAEKRDSLARTRPALVHWDALPDEERLKDLRQIQSLVDAVESCEHEDCEEFVVPVGGFACTADSAADTRTSGSVS